MKEIEIFLNSFDSSWSNKFQVQDYDFTKYDNEISFIMKMQKENNYQALIDFLNDKLEHRNFEIKHPFDDNIKLIAVYSIYNDFLSNLVFFIDKDNKHPLLFVQFSHFLNCILIRDKFLRIMEPWGDNATLSTISSSLTYIQKVKKEDLLFKNKNFGFTLKHTRPAHFFLDVFPAIYKLNIKSIDAEKSFFTPKHIKNKKADVCFYPTTTSIRKPDLVEEAMKNMLKEALEDNTRLDRIDDYHLILFLNLPTEKRFWLEQLKGIALVLKNLNIYFNKIKIYVDGLTAYDRENKKFAENDKLLNDIINESNKVFSMGGGVRKFKMPYM